MSTTTSTTTTTTTTITRINPNQASAQALTQAPTYNPKTTRVLVFGTGSIGAIYTYLLSTYLPSRSQIVAVCRSNYTAALENGFTINSSHWGVNLNCRPTIVRSVEEAISLPSTNDSTSTPASSSEPFDYIIVTAKAITQIPSTAELIAPAVTPGRTSVVLIQNGIAVERDYALRFPDNPIISGVVYLPATQTSPAVVAHKETELLHVGTYPSARVASDSGGVVPKWHELATSRFAELLGNAGATVRVHEDVQVERWRKLLVNASWNPICALSRVRDVEFLRSSNTKEGNEEEALNYVTEVMREIALIARAAGYEEIDEGVVRFQIDRAQARDLPGVEPSMMADALAGRGLEVEAIVGNVLAVARERGLGRRETPLLWSLWVLGRGLDSSFRLRRREEIGKRG